MTCKFCQKQHPFESTSIESYTMDTVANVTGSYPRYSHFCKSASDCELVGIKLLMRKIPMDVEKWNHFRNLSEQRPKISCYESYKKKTEEAAKKAWIKKERVKYASQHHISCEEDYPEDLREYESDGELASEESSVCAYYY